MALTEIPIELSSTPSIVDGGNATAITINADESVALANKLSLGTDSGDAFNSSSMIKVQTSGNGYVQLKTSTTSSAGILFGDTDDDFAGGMIYDNNLNTLYFTANNAERMRIDSSGNVAIGSTAALLTATNRGNITINGATQSVVALGTGGAESGYLYHNGTDLSVYNIKNGVIRFGTNDSERLQITSGGEIFANQQYTGGFGGVTTGGTASFDHSSNARAGNAYTLLQGIATGGPGGTAYYHVFNYEYNSKDSTGNMTQLAYGYNDAKAYMRYRYSGTWGSWVALH
jgi:hypothetical protein